MESRIDYLKHSQKPTQLMLGIEAHLKSCGLPAKLLHLVKMRASIINGCAFCLDMHSKDARAAGESEQRLYALPAWAETPFFDPKERAALEWTEALTTLEGHVPDEVYARVSAQFSEEELVNLSFAITNINAWNRLCIGFRAVPGAYQPGMFKLPA
jgi:AhpD family alkylhydroperoxidase